jgi:hypothetical protein
MCVPSPAGGMRHSIHPVSCTSAMATMVVFRCPETGEEVPTGLTSDLANFQGLPEGFASVRCPHCKCRHEWSRATAYLSVAPKRLATRQLRRGRRRQ